MIIKPRSAWGAAPPSAPLISIPTPTPVVYVHHSAVEAFGPSALRQFQQFHMNVKDMRDIAYSFLIDLDATIWEGRGWGKAHGGNTGTDNSISHSICLMGNFQNKALPAGQENALIELLREGKRRGAWLLTDIRGHQQEPGSSTACPGSNVMVRLPTIRVRAKEPASTPTPTPTPTPLEEVLMDQAINFYVRNVENGAVLYVMRNLHSHDFPVSSMGVNGPWDAPDGAIVWNMQPDDFNFFNRYRIDNKPVPTETG